MPKRSTCQIGQHACCRSLSVGQDARLHTRDSKLCCSVGHALTCIWCRNVSAVVGGGQLTCTPVFTRTSALHVRTTMSSSRCVHSQLACTPHAVECSR